MYQRSGIIAGGRKGSSRWIPDLDVAEWAKRPLKIVKASTNFCVLQYIDIFKLFEILEKRRHFVSKRLQSRTIPSGFNFRFPHKIQRVIFLQKLGTGVASKSKDSIKPNHEQSWDGKPRIPPIGMAGLPNSTQRPGYCGGAWPKMVIRSFLCRLLRR